MSRCVTVETEEITMPTCDTETCTDGEEDKRALSKKEEAKSEEELNRFPTLSNAAASANDVRPDDQVGAAGGAAFCQQTGDSGDDGCWAATDQEASRPERKLQQSVDRLRTLMEMDACRERRTGGPTPPLLAFLRSGLETLPFCEEHRLIRPVFIVQQVTRGGPSSC